jgi:hypothetical protein
MRHLDVAGIEKGIGVVDRIGETRHAAHMRAFANALGAIGWCGDGVTVKSVSHFGVSTAVGRKKSMKDAPMTLPISS